VVVFVVCVQCWCYKYGVVICCEEIGSFARACNCSLACSLGNSRLSRRRERREKERRESRDFERLIRNPSKQIQAHLFIAVSSIDFVL
jgi:hypothetical protein